MADRGPKFESIWIRHSALFLALIVGFVFALGMLQDIFLVHAGFSRWSLIVLSNIANGVIAGALFYQFVKNEKIRHAMVRERMRTIAELNHHIRNALQVIKFWGAQHQNCSIDDAQLQLMRDSVDRIEWALRELLPPYPGVPAEIAEPEPHEPALQAREARLPAHPLQQHTKPH